MPASYDAFNMQASLLRREKSRTIGMIVPKYDSRYFGPIVQTFETMARERGLFPTNHDIRSSMRDIMRSIATLSETIGLMGRAFSGLRAFDDILGI